MAFLRYNNKYKKNYYCRKYITVIIRIKIDWGGIIMENQVENFKNAVIKKLEEQNRLGLLSVLRSTQFEIDETHDFTYYEGYNRGWNTYCTYLRIYSPIQFHKLINENKSIIQQIAEQLYGKQGNNYLVDTFIHLSDEYHEIIEMEIEKKSELVSQAIEDAENFMSNGKYDKAFDRIHTAFHGYLRSILDEYGIGFDRNDSLPKLYNKIHSLIDKAVSPEEIAENVKKVIRSANGMIQTVNEIRNNHSLAHPNEKIIGKNEAKLVIGLIKNIVSYLESYIN